MFHYLGPAFAVLLFARVDVLGVAWLRIAAAAAGLRRLAAPVAAWRRLDRPTDGCWPGLGAVLAVMNSVFYLAIERLPLGTVAAIEFLPVVGLAALAARTRRNLARPGRSRSAASTWSPTSGWSPNRSASPSPPPTPCCSPATSCSATGSPKNDRVPGIDGLAIAMLIAAVVALPIGAAAAPAFTDPLRSPPRPASGSPRR